MSLSIRVALGQSGGQPQSVDEALDLVSRFASEAAAGSADLLMLPELALSGYGDIELTRNWALSLEQASSRLGEIARAHGIGLLVGYSERLEAGFANSAIMLDADGRRLLNYRKMHLWGNYEEEVFTPGVRGEVVELRTGIKAGVLICFDLDHPVTAQDLTSRSANVILVLSATSDPYDVVPMVQVPARAYENSAFYCLLQQGRFAERPQLHRIEHRGCARRKRDCPWWKVPRRAYHCRPRSIEI